MTTIATVDLRRRLAPFYRPGPDPELVDVPELPFLMIDGIGAPGGPVHTDALQALYSVAYTVRFALKRGAPALDVPVMPLEGLWWVPDMAQWLTASRDTWQWTLMIVQAEEATAELLAEAQAQVARTKHLAAVDRVRLERFAEGRAAQVMHLGPYSAEGPTIERLHRFIAEHGYVLTGKHHEIYLGDPRRAAPEKLRTVIRQPVAPA